MEYIFATNQFTLVHWKINIEQKFRENLNFKIENT